MAISLRTALLALCAASSSLLTPAACSSQLNSDHARRQDDDGYIGYRLEQRGDAESAVYETAGTNASADATLPGDPDVYLNASVSVGEIDIEVDNITAKVNLQADVLKLLHFSAGVDASIDKVRLSIQNVSAKVLLEARLENVVTMIGDVLDSIDLNPLIATLGEDVSEIVNSTVGDLTGSSSSSSSSSSNTTSSTKRSVQLDNANVLYSVNDYSGNRHTNRVLAQNGDIVDVRLDNDGSELPHGRRTVGHYARDMAFTGHNRTISVDDVPREFELGYLYAPLPGVKAYCWVYLRPNGKVSRTEVIAEAFGGGTSTLSEDDDGGDGDGNVDEDL